MPRWLRAIALLLALIATAGLPTVVVAASVCDDGDRGAAEPRCPEDGESGCGGCAPFCHGCLCRPHFGAAAPGVTVGSSIEDPELISFLPPLERHEAPPPRRVFHPPRPSA